ncbi:hypothetical protein N183_19545 [Sinorhizobium sp. Sb3]|nr:hypothetical protein N183_19545 [Sinorhizobium sp. Sb3]
MGAFGLCEPAICGDEALEHRHNQFKRIADRTPGLATELFRTVDEVAMQGCRQFDADLHRLVVRDRPEFQLRHQDSP